LVCHCNVFHVLTENIENYCLYYKSSKLSNFWPTNEQNHHDGLDLFWVELNNKKGPLEMNEILGSTGEDRLLDLFFEMVQNTVLVRFSYLLRLYNFCKAPRDMRHFPQEAVLRARRL